MIPLDARAVMASRREPPTSLDFFPTPPWATRALVECVLRPRGLMSATDDVWEPACGEGHMSAVLAESFAHVSATDVFAYAGLGPDRRPVGWLGTFDVLGEDANDRVFDWIVTNPPFKTADAFARRLVPLASKGTALLVRTAWLEGGDRYLRLFRDLPPTLIAQFCERVPMTRGRWDPAADTATAYAWVIWRRPLPAHGFRPNRPTEFAWIPPGQRRALTRADDAVRFGVRTPLPLLKAAE